jgi:hypothetical protein
VRRQPVRVVARRRDHRQDRSALRVQGNHRSVGVLAQVEQPLVRRTLRGRVDGQCDAAAFRLVAADKVDDPVDEQARIVPEKDQVLAVLQPADPYWNE